MTTKAFKFERGTRGWDLFEEYRTKGNEYWDITHKFMLGLGFPEETAFYGDADRLWPDPWPEELREKYRSQITKDGAFKKNTKINKEYLELVKHIKRKYKERKFPDLWELGINWRYKSKSSRLLTEDAIYVLAEADHFDSIADDVLEVPISEYYTVLEQIEEGK